MSASEKGTPPNCSAWALSPRQGKQKSCGLYCSSCATRAFLNGQVYKGFGFLSLHISTSCKIVLSIFFYMIMALQTCIQLCSWTHLFTFLSWLYPSYFLCVHLKNKGKKNIQRQNGTLVTQCVRSFLLNVSEPF